MSATKEMGPTPQEAKALVTRISQLRTRLTMWAPFFGHLLLKMEPIVAGPNHRVPTMAVSRDRKLYINPKWSETLTDNQMLFVLCHEVMHLAYQCFPRGESRKAIVYQKVPCGICGARGQVLFEGREAEGPQTCPACQGEKTQMQPVSLWNIAHDFAINDIIKQMVDRDESMQLGMPEGGCWDPKFRGQSAEEIYDYLLDQANQNPMSGPGQGGQGQGQAGQGQGQPQPGQGKGKGQLSQVPEGAWGVDDIRDDLGGQGSEDKDASGRGTEHVSEAEKQEMDDYWKVAVVEAAEIHKQRKKGVLPGQLQKLIEEITDPKIAWADVLSRWVGENGNRADFTYRRPSRRSEAVGVFMPSVQRFGVDDIIVLGDTSGSMGGREAEIASETWGICEDLNLSLRFIACDTHIREDRQIEGEEDLVDAFKGGGGSNFKPAFEQLDREGYEGVVIAFTDGYISVPETKPPHIKAVLWVIWRNDVDPTNGRWGEVLFVDDEGYCR